MYLIIETYIFTNTFLLHFMAAAYHSSYSLAHCSIDFLKSWKSLEKKKKSSFHQTTLRNSVAVFKGVGIRRMPNLHYMSKGFVRLTSSFSFEKLESFESLDLKTQSHNSVWGRGRRSQIAMSRVWMVPISSERSSTLWWLLEQISQNHPVPEATEKNAAQAAGSFNSTAGYFVPKPSGHLMNVGLHPPYLMQLWMCL